MKKTLPVILNILGAISAIICILAFSSMDSNFVNPDDGIKTKNIFTITFITTILLLMISRVLKRKNA
jgi:uncharacterized membrane protein